MRIGFYLQNENIKGVDCSTPEKGNPGIGGTEYLFYAIPYYLSQLPKEENNHEIILLASSIDDLPKNLKSVQVTDRNSIVSLSHELGLDAIVMRYSFENYLLSKELKDLSIIMWSHNFIRRQGLNQISKSPWIKAIVAVGSEQLNFYRDHKAFNKSVLIFNGFPIKNFVQTKHNKIIPFKRRENIVSYMGSLVDFKGFHILAKAWKKVIEEIPDAKLNVIGGGKLYDRNQKLGKWGIAEENYENRFMPYLLDEKGNIMESVRFLGVLGEEKNDVLNATKVGVPNPSGVSETFCIAALEMQLWGSIVTTIDYGGFKDTVYKTGILYKDPDDLANSIIAQLRKTDNDYQGYLDFADRYDFETVIKDWLRLFDALESGMQISTILKPICKSKRAEEINRKIKSFLPLGMLLPTMMFYRSVVNRIKLLFNKLNS